LQRARDRRAHPRSRSISDTRLGPSSSSNPRVANLGTGSRGLLPLTVVLYSARFIRLRELAFAKVERFRTYYLAAQAYLRERFAIIRDRELAPVPLKMEIFTSSPCSEVDHSAVYSGIIIVIAVPSAGSKLIGNNFNHTCNFNESRCCP